MSELLPCPFCGGTNLSDASDEGLDWVQCHSCDAQGPINPQSGSDEEPIFDWTWNTRATTEQTGVQGEANNACQIMLAAYALCPSDMSHPRKMQWMADYFIKNYKAQPASRDGV